MIDELTRSSAPLIARMAEEIGLAVPAQPPKIVGRAKERAEDEVSVLCREGRRTQVKGLQEETAVLSLLPRRDKHKKPVFPPSACPDR